MRLKWAVSYLNSELICGPCCGLNQDGRIDELRNLFYDRNLILPFTLLSPSWPSILKIGLHQGYIPNMLPLDIA